MIVYKDEVQESSFPRDADAIKGMAVYRAAACNCRYAEAFKIVKEIDSFISIL